jgi:hypothetical protein
MYGINAVAVLVAAAASLVASMVWYSIVGGSMAELQRQWRGAAAGSDRPMIWTLLVFRDDLAGDRDGGRGVVPADRDHRLAAVGRPGSAAVDRFLRDPMGRIRHG